MRHYILTRLGIGIARRSFFDHHVSLLEIGLAKCLKEQTARSFEWLVVTDKNIPLDILERLSAVIKPANGKVILFDPISARTMFPRAQELINVADDSDALVSRIDDDDLIVSNLVEKLHNESKHLSSNLASISFADGLYINVASAHYKKRFHPTTPVFLSTLSSQNNLTTPYQGNHNKIHERIEAAGGRSLILRSSLPMWDYILRSSSDSNSSRDNVRSFQLKDVNLDDFIYRCGLPDDWLKRAQELHISENDPRPEILGSSRPRLSMKATYLKLIRELEKMGKLEDQMLEALRAAFYAL